MFVFGSEGMLGFMVHNYLKIHYPGKIVPVARNVFDILNDDIGAWAAKQQLNQNDVIVNCTGLTNRHLDRTEHEFMMVNADFPKLLGKLSSNLCFQAVHVSTDCVFSGAKGNYFENDTPDAVDIYGVSKRKGESDGLIVLRTSLIGIEIKNHYSLLSWVISNQNGTIDGYTNHYWNGITTLQFAKIIGWFLEHGFPENNVYHIHSPSSVSKFQLLMEFAEIFGIPVKIRPVKPGRALDRTLNSLHTLCADLGIPEINAQLEEMRDYCQKHGIQWRSI